jgi:hypothetical protein
MLAGNATNHCNPRQWWCGDTVNIMKNMKACKAQVDGWHN